MEVEGSRKGGKPERIIGEDYSAKKTKTDGMKGSVDSFLEIKVDRSYSNSGRRNKSGHICFKGDSHM